MIKKMMLARLPVGKQIIDDITNEVGGELNSIFNDNVKKLLGGILIAGGIIGIFWSIGQMKQGKQAMLGIVAGVVSVIAGGVLLTMTFKLF